MIDRLTPLVLVKNDAYWLPYVLESVKNHFNRFVLYDVNSQDGTKDILQWFKDSNPKKEIILEFFPETEPRVQVSYRNAQIAEAGTEWYLLLDGDELWPKSSLDLLEQEFFDFQLKRKRYGIVNRTEMCADLTSAYSPNSYTNHHRVYHWSSSWKTSHPGEEARIKQKPENEFKFSQGIEVVHFHNPLRSPLEHAVPSRISRKSKSTYMPGAIEPFDLFAKLPILKKPIHNFIVNPVLAAMQAKL